MMSCNYIVIALENYKKSGGHDTSLEKFENKNFTIKVIDFLIA